MAILTKIGSTEVENISGEDYYYIFSAIELEVSLIYQVKEIKEAYAIPV